MGLRVRSKGFSTKPRFSSVTTPRMTGEGGVDSPELEPALRHFAHNRRPVGEGELERPLGLELAILPDLLRQDRVRRAAVDEEANRARSLARRTHVHVDVDQAHSVLVSSPPRPGKSSYVF
jgi:hypothetical protein